MSSAHLCINQERKLEKEKYLTHIIMTILNTIIETKQESLAKKKLQVPAYTFNTLRSGLSMRKALEQSPTGIIAEIKRSAPSSGSLNEEIDIVQLARDYERAGASAISVLTDEPFFKGSIEDLRKVREAVNIPLLRKDFIIDEYQILEAKDAGADCILLIAAALDPAEASHLSRFASQLGLEVLLEVHNQEELDSHQDVPCDLIGVNNRNLKDFSIDLSISVLLASKLPAGALPISESGIKEASEIQQLGFHGYKGFLIGSHFMKQADPSVALGSLVTELFQSRDAINRVSHHGWPG
jgi:indole-3-glycerol phosphate synthase